MSSIDTSPAFEPDFNCWRPEDSEDIGVGEYAMQHAMQPWSMVVRQEIPCS